MSGHKQDELKEKLGLDKDKKPFVPEIEVPEVSTFDEYEDAINAR